jgi:hypothetical protein
MIWGRGLPWSLKQGGGFILHTALLSLVAVSFIARFSLYEEEAEEDDDNDDGERSPIITLRVVCPRCLRQRVAAGRRNVHCYGAWWHPHGRIKMWRIKYYLRRSDS